MCLENRKLSRANVVLVLFWALGAAFGARGAVEPTNWVEQWHFSMLSHSDSSPAIGKDETIYFGDFYGTLWALNANGARQWAYRTYVEIRSSPALGTDGTVYFGCRDRKFYALTAAGRKRWAFKTGGWVDSSPALAADGAVYFGSWDKRLYALAPDGSKKWQFETGGPIVSSPAIDLHGRIYFGSHDHKLYALEPDGKKAWEFDAGGAIISSPALDGEGGCYFTSLDGCCYALNPDGSLRWRLKTGGVSPASPVIQQDGGVLLGVNEKLLAISPEGKQEWLRQTTIGSFNHVSGPVALANGMLCLIDGNESLELWDAQQQRLCNFYLIGHGRYASPAIGPTGALYTSGSWSKFHAFRSNVPLARTPWPKFRADLANTGRVAR